MHTHVPPWRRALKGAVAALTAIATLAVGLVTTDTALALDHTNTPATGSTPAGTA